MRFLALAGMLAAATIGALGAMSGGVVAVAAEGKAARIGLQAELAAPDEVRLRWREPDPDAAGHILEMASAADGDYVIVAFCPPHLSEFKHARLAPETTFFYRVRAFYGAASEPVTVALPKGLSDADYAAAYAKAEDYEWAAPVRRAEAQTVAQRALKDPAGAKQAGPTDLVAKLVPTTVSGFLLTWTDRARDEEGFLLEKVLDDKREFLVCAFVEPDKNSFGWAFEPPTREGRFRVRAIYYGAASNVVRQTTGAAPRDGDAVAGDGERARK
jgi:hypothetical protein